MLPEEWYSKARDALAFAVAGFDSSGIPSIACFLSHQAAELAIKGCISERGGQPPRVHDLPRLLLHCSDLDDAIVIREEDALLLNPWYIPGRYPVQGLITATEQDAREAIAAAGRILDATGAHRT